MEQSLNLEWTNLHLQVKKSEFNIWKCQTREEEKVILDNVSGSLESGQLVAILGESGAGKTTLLAAISYRFIGPLNGQLLLNGTKIDRKTMMKISCFVPQFEITFNSLTPSEHLYFMAELKLNKKWSRTRKIQRVEFLLRELGLQNVENNRISSLSGGERKKLSLAVDLLTNPPIMFCDEPTTGLDSFNAKKVVSSLKYLSSTWSNESLDSFDQSNGFEMSLNSKVPPKAIICSIHQPTSDIFQQFSQIILMHAGRSIFQGTTEEALDYFMNLGFRCPLSYNPADFFIRILSDAGNQIEPVISKEITDTRKRSIKRPSQDPFFAQNYENHNTGWLKQIGVLIQRNYINAKRSLRSFFVQSCIYLVSFTIFGILFSKMSGTTQESIQDVQGAIFVLVCEVMFTTMYRILHTYISITPLLRRETNERIYSLSAYYVADFLSDLPFLSIRVLFGLTINYLLAGFSKGAKFFFQMYLTLALLSFTANAYGLMLVGVFRSLILEIPTVTNLVFMTLSGAYINLDLLLIVWLFTFFFLTIQVFIIKIILSKIKFFLLSYSNFNI